MPTTPYSGQDIYCDQIIPGILPVVKVLETETVLAFHHTRPHWQVHIMVIPKVHIDSLLSLGAQDQEILNEMLTVLQKVANQIIVEHGAAAIITHLGSYQDSKHLHWHVHFGQALR